MMFIYDYFMQDNRFMGIFGIVAVIAVAFLFSNNKCKVNYRLVLTALTMQFALAFFILKTSVGKLIFTKIAAGVEQLYKFAEAGAAFVCGSLADSSGPWGMIFAVKVIPIIVFFGALMSLLYHLRVVQVVVGLVTRVMRPVLGTSGAETVCAAANSMLGQTEAPLLIKHYLPSMTRSEVLVVMVSGMATISGSIMAVYGSMGVPMIHMLTASMMAVPGSILIAKILIPETEAPKTATAEGMDAQPTTSNILDAISQGTSDGLNLAVNVAAMLITFISLMAFVNFILGSASTTVAGWCGVMLDTPYTLDVIFGKAFYWVARLIGITAADSEVAGSLLGQKLVINEFVAYLSFAKAELCERSQTILTYALCGFANFSCIGIQIGGIGALAPSKRQQLTQLGMLALFGATLTNLLNAAIAGLFV